CFVTSLYHPLSLHDALPISPYHHHDQNWTFTVRASRRFTRSIKRRCPQKIFACPVMPGFSNIDPLSISVVTRIVFGAELLLEGGGVGKSAVSPEEEGANALVAIEVTAPLKVSLG